MEDLNQMKSVPGEFGKGLITKVDAMVNRNPDLKVLINYTKTIQAKCTQIRRFITTFYFRAYNKL